MTPGSASTRLTAREREIANLLGLGLTNKEIAARLKISQRTADTHVQNMLNKLGASNRAQIVALTAVDHAPDQPMMAARPAIEPPVARAGGRRRPPLLARAPARLAALAAGGMAAALLLPADEQTSLLASSGGAATSIATQGQIFDPFTGTDLDTAVWDVGTSERVYVSQSGGHLGMYVAASAPPLFNGGVSTVCQAGGDFDAQVSFQLVTWPRDDGVWVSLIASGTPFNTYRVSMSGMESYGTYLPPAGRLVKAVGTSGSLRLSRQHSKWSGYYLVNGRWSRIASGDGPATDVGMSVLVFNGDVAAFGGREALVYFKDFNLVADRLVCP